MEILEAASMTTFCLIASRDIESLNIEYQSGKLVDRKSRELIPSHSL